MIDSAIDERIPLERVKSWSIFESKSNILLSALHHAREPLSLSMIVYLMIQILWVAKHEALLFQGQNYHKFFSFGNFVIIPAVNRDSYEFINSHFGTDKWNQAKRKRKNMNLEIMCENPFFNSNLTDFELKIKSGVDINRNYLTSNWGKDDGSSANPCEDGYRGKA